MNWSEERWKEEIEEHLNTLPFLGCSIQEYLDELVHNGHKEVAERVLVEYNKRNYTNIIME